MGVSRLFPTIPRMVSAPLDVASLHRVGVTVSRVPILGDIDLEIAPGEIWGLTGPNGAGKTTLLAVLATLQQPTDGTGIVLGAELGTAAVRVVRHRIGLSGHDPGLYPELTLAENLRLHARLAGRPEADADAALDLVGLAGSAGRRADRSSNGMQRRVDLARLLMIEPDLLLLDEAHAGLDSASEILVDELLRRTRSRGGAAVIVSHDADRLRARADRLLALEAGTVAG